MQLSKNSGMRSLTYVFVASVLLITKPCLAQDWRVVASGGGQVAIGSYTLGATIGQAVAGTVTVGSNTLHAGFWQNFGPFTCCVGRVGDVNGLDGDEPTIGDVAVLIDARFITLSCDGLIDCIAEADLNQSGGIDPICTDLTIGDVAVLVDYLYISQAPELLLDCL